MWVYKITANGRVLPIAGNFIFARPELLHGFFDKVKY
jgi:hypothetical protein